MENFDEQNDRLFLEDQIEIPELTQYQKICDCACFHCARVPIIKKVFINNWEVSLSFPIAVCFVILSSYLVFLFVHTKICSWINFWIILGITVLMLLFITSYFVGIYEGPGYLPFYYPYRLENIIKNRKITENDINLSGIVTTKEQFIFINNQAPMHRVKFFRSARRIVLRPDHFCGWFATFIGRKNHKLFFLFNFWGMIYISFFFGFDVYCLYICLNTIELMGPPFIFCLIYSILGFFFLIMTGSFTFETAINITQNYTSFEKMTQERNKRVYRPRYNCLESWENVFGPVSKWYTWIIPIGAFHNVDPYDLVIEHVSDKML